MIRSLMFWLALLPGIAFTQDSTAIHTYGKLPFILKIAPLELINFFQQSAGLRADIPLARRWGLELGANAVFNSSTLAVNKGEHYRGMKWRVALKYYLKRSEKEDFYVSLSVKYNAINHDRFINVFRQGRQYTEWVLERRHINTWGLGVRFGVQNYLRKNKHLMLEPFSGFGIRYTKIYEDNLSPDAEPLGENTFFNIIRPPGTYAYPDIMVGFFLGWVK